MKVNERRTVVGGVDWPLDWPSISLHGWGGHTTVERDRRAWLAETTNDIGMDNLSIVHKFDDSPSPVRIRMSIRRWQEDESIESNDGLVTGSEWIAETAFNYSGRRKSLSVSHIAAGVSVSVRQCHGRPTQRGDVTAS